MIDRYTLIMLMIDYYPCILWQPFSDVFHCFSVCLCEALVNSRVLVAEKCAESARSGSWKGGRMKEGNV